MKIRYYSQQSNNPTEEINIRKEVQGVKEWDEGYEELKAIPNSFVVEFTERGKVWMMYADSEEDKVNHPLL
jgi:hypothetical protein